MNTKQEILQVLERNDGICLDNDEERNLLSLQLGILFNDMLIERLDNLKAELFGEE